MQQMYQTKESLEEDYRGRSEHSILIKKLQSAPSRLSDLETTYWAIGNCPSCPECICADFLGKEFVTAVGIAAMTPVLLAAKVAWACK